MDFGLNRTKPRSIKNRLGVFDGLLARSIPDGFKPLPMQISQQLEKGKNHDVCSNVCDSTARVLDLALGLSKLNEPWNQRCGLCNGYCKLYKSADNSCVYTNQHRYQRSSLFARFESFRKYSGISQNWNSFSLYVFARCLGRQHNPLFYRVHEC